MTNKIENIVATVAEDTEVCEDAYAEMLHAYKKMNIDAEKKISAMLSNIYNNIIITADKYKTVVGVDHVYELISSRESGEFDIIGALQEADRIAKDTSNMLMLCIDNSSFVSAKDLQKEFHSRFFNKDYKMTTFVKHIQDLVYIEIMQNIGKLIDDVVEFEQEVREQIVYEFELLQEEDSDRTEEWIQSEDHKLYVDEVNALIFTQDTVEEIKKELND